MDTDQIRSRIASAFLALLITVLGWIILDIQEIKGNRYTSIHAEKDAKTREALRKQDLIHQRELHQLSEKRMDRLLERLERLEDKVEKSE